MQGMMPEAADVADFVTAFAECRRIWVCISRHISILSIVIVIVIVLEYLTLGF